MIDQVKLHLATSKPKTSERSEALSNPFGLPRGEKLRREVKAVFRAQRTAILHYLKTGKKDQTPFPFHWPAWHDFGLGALEVSKRMTPILKATWDDAAGTFAPRVGLDPDEWSVVNPHTEAMINAAALAFSDSMNQTTSLQLDDALAKTRETLVEGVVKQGETLEQLTKRINVIFDGAEKHRARRIAQTETSRAVHAAQEQAAIESGVVTGWEWLASADACPKCIAVYRRAPSVRLGQPFAVVGDNPHYKTIKFPPLHPHPLQLYRPRSPRHRSAADLARNASAALSRHPGRARPGCGPDDRADQHGVPLRREAEEAEAEAQTSQKA